MADITRVVVRTQEYTEQWQSVEDLPVDWSTMSVTDRNDWLLQNAAYQSSDSGDFTAPEEVTSISAE